MESDQPGGQTPPQQPPQGEQVSPEQEEMLRQMEEEMRKVRVQDVLTQSVVSILNLSARRIAKADERDLEQARIGIDAVRALVELLEPEQQGEVRNALSQVQMLYAQHAGEGEAPGAEPGTPGAGAEPGGAGPSAPSEQRPASSKLWTPGS